MSARPDPSDPGLAASPDEPSDLVRLRLDVAYDGTDFSGWASQPGLRTVQETLEAALARVLRLPHPPRLTCAGRTDAGVHARGQVCHVDVPRSVFAGVGGSTGSASNGPSDHTPGRALRDRLLGVLPPDLRVYDLSVAPEGFDARFSALSRRYVFRVCDAPTVLDPLRRREVLVHPRPLDLDAMDAAGRGLLGEHDFAAYCRRREGASTVRALQELRWDRDASGVATATVVADAFCHSMVRALVGALLAVGEGRRPVGWPAEVLAARRRDPAVTVVRPHGLTLEEVRYPAAEVLLARAEEARRYRELQVDE